MPVLRSREIIPVVKLKTTGNRLDSGAFEPETPAKTSEGMDDKFSVSSLCADQETAGLGAGAVRRRSVRLTSKSDLGLSEVREDVKTSSRERKKLDSGDNGISSNGLNLGTPECENHRDIENDDLNLGAEEDRVGDRIDPETGVLEDMDLVGIVAGIEETRMEVNTPASSADLQTPEWSDGRDEGTPKGQRKRKLGTQILLGLEHAWQGESEKMFLNLRSGKRIAKMEVKGGDDDSCKEVEDNINGDLDCSKQNGSTLMDREANVSTRSRFAGDTKEVENGSSVNGNRFSREEKGKDKVLESPATRAVGFVKMKTEVEEVDRNKAAVENETSVETRSNSRMYKGMEKLVETGVEVENGGTASDSSDSTSSEDADHIAEVISRQYAGKKRGYLHDRFRDIAKRNASRFAHFSSQAEAKEDDVADAPGREIPPPDTNGEMEDWPGPFSTAMKIIRDHQKNENMYNFSDKSEAASVSWVPNERQKCNLQKKLVPQLQDLCLSILVKNSDAITSLDCIPDALRHKLSDSLCNSRRMDSHFLDLLVHGSPTEIHLRDCSWLTEEDFIRAFERCDVSKLTVLQLDQCGHCLPDYILSTTLARSPTSLPALASLSFRGAYRFSDAGMSVLVSSAHVLRSINLSQCSLLTSDGIRCLAASLGSVLKELYIDDCQGIDAMLILPALLRLENLEVLSLAGIETVSDDFIYEFVVTRGHNMKELVLAHCKKLTDSSTKVIAETCPRLCAIDLSNLCKLTDAAIGYLANGCQAIQNLKLCRNAFSDAAVAAFVETRGESLKELSLSNVVMVAENTAISLARHSRNLNILDLSWCRNLTDEALGLIVDSCSSLKVLKVFGCTQITDVFLSGHSNPEVEIIGLKTKPMLVHLNSPDFVLGPLRYSMFSRPV